MVTLSAGARPIGVVTVERYVTHRDPHELPGELPDVLHFLQHAASALENVMIRAAYRTIGQAVLDARAMQPTVTRVLEAVSEALGCDYALLYLVDDGAGRPGWPRAWAGPGAMSRASDGGALPAGRQPSRGEQPAGGAHADRARHGRAAGRGRRRAFRAAAIHAGLPAAARGERGSGHAGAGLCGRRARPAGRGEQAHLRRVRRPGRHRGAQHAVAAPHRRGAGAQDGGARRGPGDPAQPAAESVPGMRPAGSSPRPTARRASSAATSTTSASWPTSRRGSAW